MWAKTNHRGYSTTKGHLRMFSLCQMSLFNCKWNFKDFIFLKEVTRSDKAFLFVCRWKILKATSKIFKLKIAEADKI